MDKTTMVGNQETSYPEESEEPLHRSLFGNDCFRVFCAVIPPGAETLYHRHSHDSLVVVVEGGDQATSVRGPSRTDRFVFPGPAGVFRKLRAGIEGLLRGSMRFRSGEFFATLYRGHPIVHKVAASRKNADALRLMDIQLLAHRPAPIEGESTAARNARKRIEVPRFVVYTAKLNPGAAPLSFRATTPSLVVSLDGGLALAGGTLRDDVPAELGKGQFRSVQCGERLELGCASRAVSSALILALR